MAERGDVLQLKRRLGFGADKAGERVVVVQATPLNSSLSTTIIVPLDRDPLWAGKSLAVRILPNESGAEQDLFALCTHVRVVIGDRLNPGRTGRLEPRTLGELDHKLRLVLDL